MKKLLSIVVAVALILTTVLPVADIGYAADSNVTYSISGSTLTIKGTGAMEDYKKADDVPWANKRGSSSGIKKIVIQEGITHIGNNSLSCFSVVESVVIPSTVKSIGSRAFERNTALKSVTLPSGVKTIGERAFMDCSSMTTVTIQGLQGAIPANAFSGCTKLKTLSINEGVTSIEQYGFNNCALTSITLPASVRNVAVDAFDADVSVTCQDPKMVKYGQNGFRYLQTVYYDVYQNYDYAYKVLDLVNKERKAKDLSSLTLDPVLMDAAMVRAGELVLLFSHTRPNSGNCITASSYIRAENAAEGATSPEDAVDSWMNSPGHKQNILTSSYKTLGVGCIKYDGRYYWIQCFGTEHSGKSQSKPANKTITQATAFAVDKFTYKDTLQQDEAIKLAPAIRISSSTLNKGTSKTAYVYVTEYNYTFDEVYDITKVKNTGITWSSSNTEVATVSSSGTIKALKPGKTTITAKMSHYTLTKTITVTCGDSHSYSQTSLTKATTSKSGTIKYKCSACGTTKSSTIYRIKSVKLSGTSLTYNGKVRKPSVKVTDSKGKTVSSKYYTVTYSKGRKYVGTYKATIKFSGRYTGTVTRTFKIKPVKTYITDLDSKTKAFKVKWKKKTTQTSGYQIMYSTSSKFTEKYTKTIRVKGNKNYYKTIKGLKAGKKYYVKVRTYKTVDGKNYYSSWSAKKTVKTK